MHIVTVYTNLSPTPTLGGSVLVCIYQVGDKRIIVMLSSLLDTVGVRAGRSNIICRATARGETLFKHSNTQLMLGRLLGSGVQQCSKISQTASVNHLTASAWDLIGRSTLKGGRRNSVMMPIVWNDTRLLRTSCIAVPNA